jgi:hypothetical protein
MVPYLTALVPEQDVPTLSTLQFITPPFTTYIPPIEAPGPGS